MYCFLTQPFRLFAVIYEGGRYNTKAFKRNTVPSGFVLSSEKLFDFQYKKYEKSPTSLFENKKVKSSVVQLKSKKCVEPVSVSAFS